MISATDHPALFKYASVEDIRRIYGLSTGAIYTTASRHQWRRVRHEGYTLYLWDDVQDTLTKSRRTARLPH